MKKRFLLSYFWYFLITVGLFSFSAVNTFAQTDNAIQLPGVDGNSSNIDISGLNITTLPFTMEMWIKPEGTQTDNTGIIFNRPGNLGIQYSSSWQGSGKLRFMTGVSGDYGVVSGVVSPDVWHHVAVVLTDTTRAIYIDGVKTEEKGTYAANDYSAGNTYIGWDSDGAARAFKGLIDEVRVWNVAKDSAALADNKYSTLTGTETGLVGYWNFNTVNATTAVDATGNLDGVITGGTYVEKKPEITLSASDTVEIEKGYPAFDLYVTTANLNDSLFITAPAGFTVTPDTIPAADIHTPNYKVSIDAAGASAGDKGAIVFTYKKNDVVTGLDTLQVKAIVPYKRYYIKHIVSDLVIGSRTTDATIPVLSRLVPGDSSQLFSLRPVNPGSNDSIYYIVEDAGNSYFSKQASSGWNTVLGPLEEGEWKVTLESGGFYSLKNVAKGYLASDQTTPDSRLYADKSLAGNDNAHFDFLRATAVDSANTRLTSIEVDGTAVTGFDFDTLSYAVELPAGTTTVPAVMATAGNTNADVAVTAAAALPGTTTITVTAVDGTTTRTYSVDFTVAIDPTKDATLSSLSTDIGNFDPAFSPDVYTYTLYVPGKTTSVTLTAVANNTNATVSGDGAIDVSSGNVSDTVKVVAEDGTTFKQYAVHIFVDELKLQHSYTFADGTADDVVGGANGTVVGGTIENGVYTASAQGDVIELPGNDIAINKYHTITLEAYITTQNGANGGNSMLAYFGGSVGGFGANGYFMTVARQDDNSRTAISCGNESAPWSVEEGANGPELDDGNSYYLVSILTNDSISWYIDGVFQASAPLTGQNQISNLSNDHAWLCMGGYTADPTWIGSIREFNIYSGIMDSATMKERAQLNPEAASDATLSALTADAGSLSPAFDPAVTEYRDTVPAGTASVNVTATTNNANASVTGDGAVDVSSGSGTATIEVTAEDGTTTKTYTIEFVVEASTDATLSALTADAGSLSPAFDPAVTEYKDTVPAGTTSVNVTATTNDANATVTGDGAIDVSSGSGTATIEITAEDGTTTATYTIEFVVATSTGIHNNIDSRIKVYPTVSSDEFNVELSGKTGTITVFNLTGNVVSRKVATSQNETVSVPGNGIYILRVESEGMSKVVRVVKVN